MGIVSSRYDERWVNPSPAQTPQHLIIHGGFVIDDRRARQLERRAQRLGFADLRGYLQARSDAGLSIPRLAAELGVSEWTVKQSLGQGDVKLLPRAERLARQRRHATDQRLAARAAKLGFADLRAYLADRLLVRGWLLAEVTAELGAHRRTVRRLMDEYGIRRIRRTPREQAAGARGRRAQAATWQARRPPAWPSSASTTWPPTCNAATWSRAGRSGACGPSLGSGAAGWSPSWKGWAFGADTGQDRARRGSSATGAAPPRRGPPAHVAWG
jgi:AraC-like DNA-binding protein